MYPKYKDAKSIIKWIELKLIAKSTGIRGYKSMSKERLLSALSESESGESEENLDNKKITKD